MTANRRSLYAFNDKIYCEPCAWKASGEAKEEGESSQYVPLTDNSVCARCGSDNGQTDLPIIGGLPLCSICGNTVSDWPYPNWLKMSLAFLILLLAVALVNGRKYFRAGNDMYKGEHLVHQKRYAEAIPYLQRTVDLAPTSDKAVLLLAKSALLTGNIELAQKVLQGHDRGHFEDANNDNFREVDALWNRALKAMDDADQASKLVDQDGKAVQAATLMHHAADTYPEMIALKVAAETYDEGSAFERKDYDTFLAIAQKQWNEFPGPETAGAVASALACKYAVTGEPQYRQQAEEMLQKAHQLSANDLAEEKRYAEYAERIQYRLKSRQIISTAEFNRRFRSALAAKE